MARPTRSQIIPASDHDVDKIEKWPTSKQRPAGNVVPFGSRSRNSQGGDATADAGSRADKQSTENAMAAGDTSQNELTDNAYNEDMRIALSRIAEQQKQLANLLEALENPVAALNDTVAKELLQLSNDIARSVLQREVDQDPALLSEFVKTAIEQLPAAIGPPEVFAHPEDLRILRETGAPALGKVSINWTEDPSAARGNFTVRRDDSVIHGGIDAMLQRVLSQSESVS